MLLFTFTSFMHETTSLFEASFRMMEGPNRNMNISFIVIGAVGAIYWLWRQNRYNQQADQEGTIK